MSTALMRWLVLHFGNKLVDAWMHGSVVARAHLRSGSTISFFLALFFIPSNAEKPVSHSQVNRKGIKS